MDKEPKPQRPGECCERGIQNSSGDMKEFVAFFFEL